MAVNDDELEKRAVEELLKEANRGRVRAETMGPSGWMKCPLARTNKRFLLNTLRPCTTERRAANRSRGTEDSREERDRGSRHHPDNREHGYRKDIKHKREHHRSHSRSSYTCDSLTNTKLQSTDHDPHNTEQSNRTRSRSPIKEYLAPRRLTDRT